MNENKNLDSVAEYYERRWKAFRIWWHAQETYGVHYGLYDKNAKNFIKAVFNMNNYVGKLLELEKQSKMKILDAGCGVCGTSIYLAKKYQKTQFIGITNTPSQIELGKKFIDKNKLLNVQIKEMDFLKTNFKNSTFDGIFAIESAAYAEDIEKFLDEMKRILKPNGKIIILDGFRIKNNMDKFIKKIYEIYLHGRGYKKLDLPHLDSFKKNLTDKGFKEIVIKDISNKVARSQMRGVVIGIPFIISYYLKKILSFGIINSKRNFFDFSMGVSVIAPIIALKKISRYFMIYAIKKS